MTLTPRGERLAVAVTLLTVGTIIVVAFFVGQNLKESRIADTLPDTCDDITVEMLRMTDPVATRKNGLDPLPWDATYVQQLNNKRTEIGCAP